MKTGTYHKHTPETRASAVARSYETGVTETCRELSLPSSTLYAWRKRAAKSGAEGSTSEKPASEKTSQLKSTSRRRYTSAEQVTAVKLADEVGVDAACRQLGMSVSALYTWRSRGQRPEDVSETDTDAVAPSTELPDDVSETDAEDVAPSVEPAAEETAPGRAKAKGVARLYTPSEKARALEHMAEHGASATAKKFGMTRFSLYNWKKKVDRAAVGDGESPIEGPEPADIEAQRDAEILAMWHKHPGLGPSQVRNQLRRNGVKVGIKRVGDVMIDAGYRPPGSKRVPHDERFEAVRPNHLWHLDFVQRYINRCSVFTLIIIDDYSRFVIGHCCVDAERAAPVIHCFEEAVERYGRPEMVLHDKGSAFWSWNGVSRFTRLLVEMGIDQIPAQFKEWNGKLECFNRNIQKEFFNVKRFDAVATMRRHLNDHLHWYNHQRTHHSLDGVMVPADRYYGREEEVRALMAAGAGNLLDMHTISLGDRPIDVFRIVQHGTDVEIWLMGQKLLTLGK